MASAMGKIAAAPLGAICLAESGPRGLRHGLNHIAIIVAKMVELENGKI